MTRAKFLFVSALLTLVSVLGLEKRSRQWLEANGFYINEEDRSGNIRVIILHGQKNDGVEGRGASMMIGPEGFPFCYSYMRSVLGRCDFTLIRKNVRYEMVCDEADDWANVGLKEVELSLPTVHKFNRPWWV